MNEMRSREQIKSYFLYTNIHILHWVSISNKHRQTAHLPVIFTQTQSYLGRGNIN